jgi:hypothetical protein
MIDPFDLSISFEEKALKIFEHQKANNKIYKRFCEALVVQEGSSIDEIPLLPIQAFKDAIVLTEHSTQNSQHPKSNLKFESSGTSGMQRSKHLVSDPEIYRQSIFQGMNQFYDLDEYVILAYTPGYADNPNSSLVWMLNSLIETEDSGLSRFLELGKALSTSDLDEIKTAGKKVMLFGAAFGLLDLIELGSPSLPEDSIILETGGMKTHRREMTKEELHQQLADGFGISKSQVHSEYGMTELLSQAYSQGSLWFDPVPWMKVTIRNPHNPMKVLSPGEDGLIGVIDLANVNSCSFILTGDKGVQNEKGQFQVLGRWNPVNLRGCNFLIDDE